jgi:integrase
MVLLKLKEIEMLKGPRGAMEPIKDRIVILKIKEMLQDNPRDFCLFTFGINTAFRAGDTLSLNVGDVRGRSSVVIKEQKTGKRRTVFLNEAVQHAIQQLLSSRMDALDTDPLFIGAKRGTRITVETYGRLVKSWCKDAGIDGLFCSHTLRKTFGYQQRMNGASVDLLQKSFGHSSGLITMAYVGIDDAEMVKLYSNVI